MTIALRRAFIKMKAQVISSNSAYKSVFIFMLGLLCGITFFHIRDYFLELSVSNGIAIPMDAFPEPAWRTPGTLAVRTVTSTPFARFEIHKVKTENGVIVNDWLWVDERSHVNILVHLKEENKYLLFQQQKYGLERPYLAVVGASLCVCVCVCVCVCCVVF